MSTIVELQQRAAALKAKYQKESISPEEVGQLHEDTLAYMADLERYVDNLGVRKTYASKAEMDADVAPVGTNGKAMRYGQLAVIRSSDNENGNIYAYQKPGWLLVGNLNEGKVVNDLVTGGSNVPLSAEQGKVLDEKIRENAAAIPAIADNLVTDDPTKTLSAKQGKKLYEMSTEYDVSAHNGGKAYTLAGTAQVVRLTITGAPTADGAITVTLGGVTTAITITAATQTTAELVAEQIATGTFAGYTVSYTSGNAYVEFTAFSIGEGSEPNVNFETTGATGSISVTTAGSDSAIADVPSEFQRGGMTIAFNDFEVGQYSKYFCKNAIWSKTSENWINTINVDSEQVSYNDTNVHNIIDSMLLHRQIEFGINYARKIQGFYYPVLKKFLPQNGYIASELIAVPVGADSITYKYLRVLYGASLIEFDQKGNWLRIGASNDSGTLLIPSDCAFVGFNMLKGDTILNSYIRFGYKNASPKEEDKNLKNDIIIAITKAGRYNESSKSIYPEIEKFEYYFNETGIHYLKTLNNNLNIFSVTEGSVVCLHTGLPLQNYSNMYYAFFRDVELIQMVDTPVHIGDISSDGWGDTVYYTQDRVFWHVVPQGAKYLAVNDRGVIRSGSLARHTSVLYSHNINNKSYEQKYIDCYGDSLTAMVGYPQKIQDNLWLNGFNYIVRPYGVSGQGAEGVLKRLGAIPVYVKQKTTIPATGALTIVTDVITTMQQGGTLIDVQNGDRNINPCMINGVLGTLTDEKKISGNSYSYTFTRSSDGQPVIVPAGSQIFFNSMRNGQADITIIYIGTNNRLDISPDILISNIEAAAKYIRNGKYLIVGLHVYNGTWMKFDIQYLIDFNNKLKQKFGEHFVDVSGYMSQCGLEEAGMTATDEDSAEIAKGAVPVSLMISDKTHFNSTGFTILGNLIYKHIVSLGYLG